MRVLIFHNRYRQPGGEDQVAEAEAELLCARGIEVYTAFLENCRAGEPGWKESLRLAADSAWSKSSYRRAEELCRRHRPDIVHVHNFWMRWTPSVHAACRAAGAATVQTLHNFRLLCANALFLREGRVCEDCLGKAPWRGIVRGCYRGSPLASAVVARMMVVNRHRRTWQQQVDALIAPSAHARSRLAFAELPLERVFVKSNFTSDPGPPRMPPSGSRAVVYAGRLSTEKGVGWLLDAWRAFGLGDIGTLLIAGDGGERRALEAKAAALGLSAPAMQFVGWREPAAIRALLASARCVVAPSLCYETFGNTVIEAFAAGRPVVCSNLGAMGEIVASGRTGLTAAAGDTRALGEALRAVLEGAVLADRMGAAAREEYLRGYTPERNYAQLMRIYRFAMEHRGAPLAPELHEFPAALAGADEQQGSLHAILSS